MKHGLFIFTLLFSLSWLSAGQKINIDSFYEGTLPGSPGDKTIFTNFNASAASKLVLVAGGEHGFPQNTGGEFSAATYRGVSLIRVIQEGDLVPTAAVFYLDNPGAAGDLILTPGNHNGSMYGVYLLSGTETGVVTAVKSQTNTVDLVAKYTKSLVIAAVHNSGPDNGNGAPNMGANSPLIEDSITDLSVGGGSRYSSFSCAHQFVVNTGTVVNAFNNYGATDGLATVAVEFPPPPPAGTVIQLQ